MERNKSIQRIQLFELNEAGEHITAYKMLSHSMQSYLRVQNVCVIEIWLGGGGARMW